MNKYLLKRFIPFGIALVMLAGCASSMVRVFDAPIQDEALLEQIADRINQEGIEITITDDGLIIVDDAVTARRIRTILVSEDLVPTGHDPWRIYDRNCIYN